MYLVKAGNSVLVFNNMNQLKLAGFEKADMEISEEEWREKGGFARLIEGEIVIGDTKKEKAVNKKRNALEKIDCELYLLDQKQARSSSEIAEAYLTGLEINPETKKLHLERMERARQLREERKLYEKKEE